MEWLKLQAWKILAIIMTIAFGVVLFLWISNIQINITTTSNSQSISNSYAYSGSMSIGYIGSDQRGKWEIACKEIECSSNLIEDMQNFLSTLDPIQFLHAKIMRGSTHVYIFYPVITELKDKQTKDSGTTTKTSTKLKRMGE